MATVSRNLFALLDDDVEDASQTKPKAQPKAAKKKKEDEPRAVKKNIVFPGDLSGQKKKGQPTPAPKKSAPPAAPVAPVSNGNASAIKGKSAPAPKKSSVPQSSSPSISSSSSAPVKAAERGGSNLETVAGRKFRPTVDKFVNALDSALGSQSAFFKVILSGKHGDDDLRRLLRDNSYRAIDQILKDERWMSAFIEDLRVKWSADFKEGMDLSNKQQRIQFDRLKKEEFAVAIASLFCDPLVAKKPKKEPTACSLMFDLLPTIFGVDLKESKFINNLADEVESQIGSQGSIKREGPATLLDYITEPTKKKKGKKSGKKPVVHLDDDDLNHKKKPIVIQNPQSVVAPALAAPTSAEEEEEEASYDPMYNPEAFAKTLPFGWNFLRIQNSFLKADGGAAKAEGEERDFYFHGSKRDTAFVFWSGTDLFFLLTNGSN